jgi:hypothetical protein
MQLVLDLKDCPDYTWQTWCKPKSCDQPGPHKPIENVYDILSGVFGFQPLVNVKLCCVNKFRVCCLCLEELVKRLTTWLLYEGQYRGSEEEL